MVSLSGATTFSTTTLGIMTLSTMAFGITVNRYKSVKPYYHAECQNLVIMQSVVMLSVIVLSVIMLGVIALCVVMLRAIMLRVSVC